LGVLKLGGEAQRAESEEEVLGEGAASPGAARGQPASGVRGRAPAAKCFLAFYKHYMAFPGISVASGHVPVTIFQPYIM